MLAPARGEPHRGRLAAPPAQNREDGHRSEKNPRAAERGEPRRFRNARVI